MEHDIFDLWTLHEDGFSIFEGEIDLTKSKYYHMPGIMAACRKLYSKINCSNGQVLWCYSVKKPRDYRTGIKQILWHLKVPKNEILCFINDDAWSFIIGEGENSNVNNRDRYSIMSENDLWNELIHNDTCLEYPRSAIINFPVPKKWDCGDNEVYGSK